MRNTLQTLIQAFGRYRAHVAALVVFGIISALLEGIGINAVIPLMSFFVGGDGTPTDFITSTIKSLFDFFSIPFSFRYLLGFILFLFALRAVFVALFGYIRGWISADFLGKESEDVLRRTLLSSWGFFLQQKIGTMHNTLARDIQQTGILLSSVAQVVQSFSGFLVYLLVAYNISPTMTFYAVGGGATLFFLLRPLLRKAQHISEEAAGVEKQFSQFLSEHIIGMKPVKAAGKEHAAIESGAAHIRRLRLLSIRQSLARAIGASAFQPFSIVLVIVLFLVTYRTPTFSIISFAASLYLIQKVFTYLESGQNALHSISELTPYARNIAAFKKMLDEHREPERGTMRFAFAKEIAFKDVSFSYEERKPPVLNNVSFSLVAGETVGIVGPSGAGKTSVADLLLRLFQPTEGRITVDDKPLEGITSEAWRHNVGYVPQDVFLLNTSLRENIRFYRPGVGLEEIIRAAKQANIYDFINGLPDGFQTITGDRGVMLSGGQRQRIALARALVGKPELLILDEATSALDHESEKLIHESIKALHGTMTVLIIAHRPSTVADADRIVVLDRGRVVEQGTPQELLKNGESYFYKMQAA